MEGMFPYPHISYLAIRLSLPIVVQREERFKVKEKEI
jgi:hypothetical protein